MGLSISITRSSNSSTLSSNVKVKLYSFLSLVIVSGCCCLTNPILFTSTLKPPSLSVCMLKIPCALVKPNCKILSLLSFINTDALATGCLSKVTTVPLQTVCACKETVVNKAVNNTISVLGIFIFYSGYFLGSSSHSYTRSKPNLPKVLTVVVVFRSIEANIASKASSASLKYCFKVIFFDLDEGKGISSVNFSIFSNLNTTLWSLSVASRINPGSPYHFHGPAFIGISGVNQTSKLLPLKVVVAL